MPRFIGQEADISRRIPHQHQHVNGRVAVTHRRAGTVVTDSTHIIHPIIQRIQGRALSVLFWRQDGKSLRLAHFDLLGLFVLCPGRSALRAGGQRVGLPAIDILHQRGNVVGQGDGGGQELAGTPEQPFPVNRLAALVEVLRPSVQHGTAGLRHRPGTSPPLVAVQPSDTL